MNASNSITLHGELAEESLVEQNTTIYIKLFQTEGEGSAFRLNDSPGGEIQRSRIKQDESSGLILQVNQRNVVHGTYTPGGPRATLAIFEFRFLGSISHGRRFRSAVITIDFALGKEPGDILDPIVAAIIPDGHFILEESASEITETTGGNLNARIPFDTSSLGASFTYERVKKTVKETRKTMFGTSRLKGRHYGEPNSVKWVLNEDKQSRHGLPAAFTAAVILQPQTADNFRAFVHVDAEADVVYNAVSRVKRYFGVTDDPVTFSQDQQPMGPPLGLDPQNLSAAALSLTESILITRVCFRPEYGLARDKLIEINRQHTRNLAIFDKPGGLSLARGNRVSHYSADVCRNQLGGAG